MLRLRRESTAIKIQINRVRYCRGGKGGTHRAGPAATGRVLTATRNALIRWDSYEHGLERVQKCDLTIVLWCDTVWLCQAT